jgi:hypothetical protein
MKNYIYLLLTTLLLWLLISAFQLNHYLVFPNEEADYLSPSEHGEGWEDQFKYPHPRWNWAYNQGTGYKRIGAFPQGGEGIEIGITKASTQYEYSDCSLHETSKQYTQGVFESRLSLSNDNGLFGSDRGTRGWGFWAANLETIDAAWFWSASPESSAILTGLRAMVIREGVIILNQPLDVDTREWHEYRIELAADGTKFFIDGDQVASTTGRPANPQRIELWIDNMAVQVHVDEYITENLDIKQDQKMFIDWVRYLDQVPTRNFLFFPMIVH